MLSSLPRRRRQTQTRKPRRRTRAARPRRRSLAAGVKVTAHLHLRRGGPPPRLAPVLARLRPVPLPRGCRGGALCGAARNMQLFLADWPFYMNGWNSYWLMDQAVEPRSRDRVSRMFRTDTEMGLTVCRSWAFNDGTYNALQVSPGHFDERVFKTHSMKICSQVDLCNFYGLMVSSEDCVPVGQGYGLTETCAGAAFTELDDTTSLLLCEACFMGRRWLQDFLLSDVERRGSGWRTQYNKRL
ncbi:Mannan endo-1,4-beta-mannosidase 2 [Zea mays]|uniref:Mannan endo-1,4-beta-mannosidase 2 n=1 Tax=Zea mays TaxID=4577 RepID=A0A3L6EDB1_MAIZE|nr:Mannan endo-1,4-beta-mannosidase 2 [Zea mays]